MERCSTNNIFHYESKMSFQMKKWDLNDLIEETDESDALLLFFDPWTPYTPKLARNYIKQTRHLCPGAADADTIFGDRFNTELNMLSLGQMLSIKNAIEEKYNIKDEEPFVHSFFPVLFYNSLYYKNSGIDIEEEQVPKERLQWFTEEFEKFYGFKDLFDKIRLYTGKIAIRLPMERKKQPLIMWLSDLEKRTERLNIRDMNVLLLSFSQVSMFVQILVCTTLMNEDSLYRFTRTQDELERYKTMSSDEMAEEVRAKFGGNAAAFADYISERSVNYQIIYPHLASMIADMLFVNGYLDGAFHYAAQSYAGRQMPLEISIPEDSALNTKFGRLYFQEFNFLYIAQFLTAHELHHVYYSTIIADAGKILCDGLLDKLMAWSVFYFNGQIPIVTEMWEASIEPISYRNHMTIGRLLHESMGNDKEMKIVTALADELMSWDEIYSVVDHAVKGTSPVNSIKEQATQLEESYCDIMSMYDLLLNEEPCKLADVFCIIEAIVRILLIQEANYVLGQLLKIYNGEIDKIDPVNIRRLQWVLLPIQFEIAWLVGNKDEKEDILSKIDWSNISESYQKIPKDALPTFDLFSRFKDTPDFKIRLEDFLEGLTQQMDIIHEYYFVPLLHEFFHCYRAGFLNKEFHSVFVKRRIVDGIEQDPIACMKANDITNAVTYEQLQALIKKEMEEAAQEEKSHGYATKIEKIDAWSMVNLSEGISEGYSYIRNGKLFGEYWDATDTSRWKFIKPEL